MRLFKIVALAVIFSCAAMTIPATAAASQETIINDTSHHSRPQQLDVVGSAWIFGYLNWFGVGVWYGYPIVPDGFIPELNDSFFIEGGAFFSYFFANPTGTVSYSYFGVSPMAGVRWQFYLTPEWSVFATLKIGPRIPFGDSGVGVRLDPVGTVGGYWHMSDSMYVRIETGNYGFVQVGVSIIL